MFGAHAFERAQLELSTLIAARFVLGPLFVSPWTTVSQTSPSSWSDGSDGFDAPSAVSALVALREVSMSLALTLTSCALAFAALVAVAAPPALLLLRLLSHD